MHKKGSTAKPKQGNKDTTCKHQEETERLLVVAVQFVCLGCSVITLAGDGGGG